jgi:hypothetical protein
LVRGRQKTSSQVKAYQWFANEQKLPTSHFGKKAKWQSQFCLFFPGSFLLRRELANDEREGARAALT